MDWNALRRQIKRVAMHRLRASAYTPLLGALLLWLPGVLSALMLNAYILQQGNPLVALLLDLVVLILVCGPLMTGVTRFISMAMLQKPLPLSEIFAPLSSARQYFQSLRLFLYVVLRALPWLLLMLALLFAYTYLRLLQGPETLTWGDLYSLASEISVLGLLLSIPIGGRVLRYLGAYLIAAGEPARMDSPRLLVQASLQCTRGHGGKLIVFFGSFVGWQLLGMFTLGVGTVLWMTYLWMAFTQFFFELGNVNVKQLEAEMLPEDDQT